LKLAAEDVAKLDSMQALATRNWATGSFEGTEKISGTAFTERYVKKAVGCAVCGLHCDAVAQVSEGSFRVPRYVLVLNPSQV
jgi:aldehyde:ferredoxin oxidoreductase